MFIDPSKGADTYEYLFINKKRGVLPKSYAEFDELISTLIKRMPQASTAQMQHEVMRYMSDDTKLISRRSFAYTLLLLPISRQLTTSLS